MGYAVILEKVNKDIKTNSNVAHIIRDDKIISLNNCVFYNDKAKYATDFINEDMMDVVYLNNNNETCIFFDVECVSYYENLGDAIEHLIIKNTDRDVKLFINNIKKKNTKNIRKKSKPKK